MQDLSLQMTASWRAMAPTQLLEKLPTAENRRFNEANRRLRGVLDRTIAEYRNSGVGSGVVHRGRVRLDGGDHRPRDNCQPLADAPGAEVRMLPVLTLRPSELPMIPQLRYRSRTTGISEAGEYAMAS